METSLVQEFLAHLKGAKLTVLALHRHPDPDSMGSAAALGTFLDAHAIPYLFYCQSGLGEEARFFGIDPAHVLNPAELARLTLPSAEGKLGVVCTFDAGDAKFAGIEFPDRHSERSEESRTITNGILRLAPLAQDDNERRPFIVNFDHHATNTRFGNLNVIETQCASTTEIIYEFFQAVRWPIPSRTARYLLAGLLTDTDHFFNPATSAAALRMAGELLGRGAALPDLRQMLFERRPLGALRLIGEALSRLRTNPRHGVAVTYLTKEDAVRHNASFEDIEGVANILNALGEVKAMLVLKFEKGLVRGSFRTTRDDVNVGKLAELFGGGGHKKAAGFTIKGDLTEEGGRVRIV